MRTRAQSKLLATQPPSAVLARHDGWHGHAPGGTATRCCVAVHGHVGGKHGHAAARGRATHAKHVHATARGRATHAKHVHATARGHATRQSGATLNKHGRRPRGTALVLVVFTIAFISVLALAVLDQVTMDLTILRNHTSGLRALYAAHAGIGDAIAAVRLNNLATGSVPGTVTLTDGTTASYTAEIANAYPVVTITSTGQVDGFSRKVQAKVVVAGPPAKPAPYPVQIVSWREVVGSG